MTRRRVALVVNRRASRCPDDLEAAVRILREGSDLTLFSVAVPEEVPRQVSQAVHNCERLIIGSGDGTIARAASVLLAAGRPVGVLPLGNSNDLARGLGMPLDLDAACRALLDARVARIDVSRINEHYFFNAATVGIGAAVSAQMVPEAKRRWRRLSQVTRLVSALRQRRRFRVDLELDGARETLASVHLAVANGRTHGGGIAISDEAYLDDGRLRLSSVRPQPLLRLLALGPRLARGERDRQAGVDQRNGRRVRIATSRRLPVATDGDIVTHTPATIEVMPRALSVLVPIEPEDTLALSRA